MQGPICLTVNSNIAPSEPVTPSSSIFHSTVVLFNFIALPIFGVSISVISKQSFIVSVSTIFVAPVLEIFFARSAKIFSNSSSSGVITT